MIGLTSQQRALLTFIEGQIATHGDPPTFSEMMVAIGSSRGGIHRLLTCLEERGHIRRLPGRARAIEVLRRLA